ncbi:MAG: COX15/CtaA family protein [Micropepsaceae bacterium]
MSISAIHSVPSAPRARLSAVAIWLLVVLAMTAAIVMVGGLTRLTDSGLSITEWKPVTGVIPPLSDQDWEAELQKYRSTTEYQVLNKGMTVAEFKHIFWWEWGHRILARTIGMVALIGLAIFWWRGALKGPMLRRGVGLVLLVGAQGALGWFMVASGLTGRLDVSQYRLAAHLGLAFVIFGWTLLMLLDLKSPRAGRACQPGLPLAKITLAAVFIQVLLGALVAGLDAGLTYNTWPLMDGSLVPDNLFLHQPWWTNFGDNITMVQFQHRMTAYLVAALAVATVIVAGRTKAGKPSAGLLGTVTVCQILLGVLTLLAGADGEQPVLLGAAHQFGALVLFGAVIAHWHALTGRIKG